MKSQKSPRWFIGPMLQRSWQRFREDCRAYPDGVWSRWTKTLIVGFIPTAIWTYIITRVAKSLQDQGLQTWDENTLRLLADRLPFTFAHGVTWESPGNSIGMLLVVTGLILVAVWRRRSLVAATIVVSYILQFAFAWIGWLTWNRARPDLIAEGVAAPNLHSFPSGHALGVIAVYGFVFYLWFRASHSWLEKLLAIAIFLLWVTAISGARLMLGAHWPSDIIASFMIAFPWLATVAIAYHRASKLII